MHHIIVILLIQVTSGNTDSLGDCKDSSETNSLYQRGIWLTDAVAKFRNYCMGMHWTLSDAVDT